MDVSMPDSKNYGKYMKQEDVKNMFHDINASNNVEDWIRQSCPALKKLENTGNFIKVTLPVSCANEMLKAEFYYFKSASTKFYVTRSLSYSLPVSMLPYIELVLGVTNFPPVKKVFKTTDAPGFVTPALLNSVYGIDYNKATGSVQGVFETDGEYYEPAYMQNFMTAYKIDFPFKSYISTLGDDANNPSSCDNQDTDCTESMLDVEYIMGIAQEAKTIFWEKLDDGSNVITSSQAASFAYTLDEWLADISKNTNGVEVFSISYGLNEDSQDSTFDKYNSLFNNEAMKLGLQGVSIVIAAGDQGVSGRGDPCGSTSMAANPSFPGSSPYITSVGATMGPETGVAETVCMAPTSMITSGGGFSVVNPMPDYQKSIVATYLKKHIVNNTPAKYFNASNRGYPDVAALGNLYSMSADPSQLEQVSGTSASAPVFAAMLSLVNSGRKQLKLPVIGFANPFLYSKYLSNLDAFHDITTGDNSCSDDESSCCSYGYHASTGWDPVSGLGSINFKAFRQMFGVENIPSGKTADDNGIAGEDARVNVAAGSSDSGFAWWFYLIIAAGVLAIIGSAAFYYTIVNSKSEQQTDYYPAAISKPLMTSEIRI